MKKIIFVLFITMFSIAAKAQTWVKTYENDKEGKAISGSLEDLKEAVRDGLPIRVGWGTPNRIEHVVDAKFLTIMNGDIVFAQIDPIFGQTPDLQEGFIELKEGAQWVMIAATNGKSDSMMSEIGTGKVLGHNKTQRGFKWYVRKED